MRLLVSTFCAVFVALLIMVPLAAHANSAKAQELARVEARGLKATGAKRLKSFVSVPEGQKGAVTLANGTIINLPHLSKSQQAIELGIRPEHIDVVETEGADITGVADVVEHLGSDTNIYVNVEGLGS